MAKPPRDDRPSPADGAVYAGEFDLEAAREALGGDEQLLALIATNFVEDAPQMLRDIRAAVSASDDKRLRQAAHALKGSIRYFGETVPYRLAYEVERKAASGSCDIPHRALERLELQTLRLRQTLTALANGD